MYDDQPTIPDSYAVDVALMADANNGKVLERNSPSRFVALLFAERERKQREGERCAKS